MSYFGCEQDYQGYAHRLMFVIYMLLANDLFTVRSPLVHHSWFHRSYIHHLHIL